MKRTAIEFAVCAALIAVLWPIAGRIMPEELPAPERFPQEMWRTAVVVQRPAKWDWIFDLRHQGERR